MPRQNVVAYAVTGDLPSAENGGCGLNVISSAAETRRESVAQTVSSKGATCSLDPRRSNLGRAFRGRPVTRRPNERIPMAVLLRCPRCGADMPSGRVAGLCPVCLMAQAADVDDETTSPVDGSIGVNAAGVDLPPPSHPSPPRQRSTPWAPSEQIGVYRILDKIAEGATG